MDVNNSSMLSSVNTDQSMLEKSIPKVLIFSIMLTKAWPSLPQSSTLLKLIETEERVVYTLKEDKNEFSVRIEDGVYVVDGLAIYDTMNYIKPDVCTICMGMAASMGAFLLSSGAKGKRFALPNSEVMIHQVLGGAKGQATDIEIHTRNILRTKERLNRILAENTGKDYETVVNDTERDNFMTAQEAKEYGLVDEVITNVKEIEQ